VSSTQQRLRDRKKKTVVHLKLGRASKQLLSKKKKAPMKKRKDRVLRRSKKRGRGHCSQEDKKKNMRREQTIQKHVPPSLTPRMKFFFLRHILSWPRRATGRRGGRFVGGVLSPSLIRVSELPQPPPPTLVTPPPHPFLLLRSGS
jgi:hypothetical protein